MKIQIKNLTFNDLIVLGLVLMMVYLTIKDFIEGHIISHGYRVAVGTLIDTHYKRTGRFGTVQFRFKNRIVTKEYLSMNDPTGNYQTGKKYFVKVSCQNDSIFRVDWKTPVADSLAINPPDGWPSELIYSWNE